MAYGSSITAKLGLDTGSFKQGLAEAKEALGKTAGEMGHAAGGHGDNAGASFVKGFEHHLLGTRHLSGALVAALGIEDLRKVGETIAGMIVGGTKEQFEELSKIEEQIAENQKRVSESRKSDTQKQLELERQIAQIQAKQDEVSKKRAKEAAENQESFGADMSGGDFKPVRTAADDAKEQIEDRELVKELTKAQAELNDLKVKGEKEHKALVSESTETRTKDLSLEKQIVALEKQENELLQSTAGKQLNEYDTAKKAHEILVVDRALHEAKTKLAERNNSAMKEELKRRKEIRDEQEAEADGAGRIKMLQKDLADATAAVVKSKKDDLDYQDLLNGKVEAQLRLVKELRSQERAKAEQESKQEKAADKVDDQDKLSLNELASHDSFEVGISSEARNQSSAAREILDLRAKAEEARKMGNSDESAELREKAQTMTDGLSSLKSSEKSPSAAFKDALKDTNTKLDTIEGVLKGKFLSQ